MCVNVCYRERGERNREREIEREIERGGVTDRVCLCEREYV